MTEAENWYKSAMYKFFDSVIVDIKVDVWLEKCIYQSQTSRSWLPTM